MFLVSAKTNQNGHMTSKTRCDWWKRFQHGSKTGRRQKKCTFLGRLPLRSLTAYVTFEPPGGQRTENELTIRGLKCSIVTAKGKGTVVKQGIAV